MRSKDSEAERVVMEIKVEDKKKESKTEEEMNRCRVIR